MLLDFGENPVVKCEALPYNKRNNSFISIFFPMGKRILLPIGRAMEAMKRKKGLSENMRELKLMPNNEAVRKSRESLEKCHIIREDGEFSERYSNLGKYVQRRR